MGERYLVIYRNDDGDVSVDFCSKAELEAWLNNDYWGPDMRWLTDAEVASEGSDPQNWKGERVGLIVKASGAVSPHAAEKVTRITID
jgi:hypothetical protein